MMGENGICVVLSNDCAKFNEQGVCTDCYKGYSLENGECVYS